MLAAAERLQRLTAHREKVVEQIRKRLAGAPVRDRLVSLFDPHARPLRTGTLGKPSEFGSLEQLAEATPHSKPGRRGCILPPASAPGQSGRERAAAADSGEAAAATARATRGRPRRRRPDEGERADARRARPEAGLHRRAQAAGLETHTAPPRPLPDRQRGPQLARPASPRAAPQPPERRRRR